MRKPVKKILIVGGGSSGWLSAAYIQRMLNRQDRNRVEITLVESPDIGIIGVGESTVPTLPNTLMFLGIDEAEFMRRTQATFKQAIRFVNWRESPESAPDNHFYHPFEPFPIMDGLPMHLALSQHLGNLDPASFLYEMSSQPWLCDAGRSPKSATETFARYAFHVDAVLMGRYLREVSIERGVRHIEDKVLRVSRAEDGAIAALHTETGKTLDADLFIDCSGFRSLLLQGEFNVPFESYDDHLFCDKAVALQVPTDPTQEIPPYTRSTAMDSGWIWDIHLRGRRGIGYVYSSHFIDDESAESELRKYVGVAADGVSARRLPMRVGRSQSFWVRNCVAMGLSGGFIEPLESTGIYLVEMGLKLLLDNLTLEGIQEACIRNFNLLMGEHYNRVRDFIVLHYCLTNREDTAFWRANKYNTALPDSLKHNLDLWKHRLPSSWDDGSTGNFFNHNTYLCIMGGMGKLPCIDTAYGGYVAAERIHARLKQISERSAQDVQRAPSHRAYLQEVVGAIGQYK